MSVCECGGNPRCSLCHPRREEEWQQAKERQRRTEAYCQDHCPYCGDSVWRNHRGCLVKALSERDAAQERSAALAVEVERFPDALVLIGMCYRTIRDGCAGEEGRPSRNDLIPLLRRIEAAFPGLRGYLAPDSE